MQRIEIQELQKQIEEFKQKIKEKDNLISNMQNNDWLKTESFNQSFTKKIKQLETKELETDHEIAILRLSYDKQVSLCFLL